jgi:uncharacterized protein with ParB-like and HNH nuclease domain
MPDLDNPVKRTVGDLLSTTSPRIVVSDYQRDFSWSESEADVFFRDLLAFSNQYPNDNLETQEYFLGSMVLVTGGANHLLLDGQQRLATATILLSAIREFLRLYDTNAATRLAQKYMYDNDDSTGERWYKLTLNRYDAEFFRREIQDGMGGTQIRPSLESHRLILRVRQYFDEKLRTQYDKLGGGKPAFQWSLRIMKVLLNHMSAVVVSSSDEDNASNVFETLNDRGISLSTPDLLRNLILRRAASDPQREEIIDAWRTVFEIEQDVRIDDFLRHYWISRNGDIKSRKLYHEMKNVISEQDMDSLKFSLDLQRSSMTYRQIISANDDDPGIRENLLAIKMLGAKALLPAVLSAYAVGDTNNKSAFLRALVSVYVRYVVVSNLEISRLEDVVYDLAKNLTTTGDFAAATAAIESIKPTNESFVKRFATFQLTRRDSQRYMLQELENFARRTAGKTGEFQLAGPDRVHIEHIYPQRPEKRLPDHQDLVNRFGNLTLLDSRLNQTIQNGVFAAKKPSYDGSDILLTKQLLEYPDWNRETIDTRQAALAGTALSVWR